MLRILLILGIFHLAVSQDDDDIIYDIFNDNAETNKTIETLKCAGVVDSVSECLSCYTCGHDMVKNRRTVHRLKLKDSACKVTEVCCFAVTASSARSSSNCGIGNPEGLPRKRRPALRSVLEREYPWRAWVYSTEEKTGIPLCAASYYQSRKLLTTATCVSGRDAHTLSVRFTKNEPSALQVVTVKVHEQFVPATRKNDIAILTLNAYPNPKLVQRICIPNELAEYGTACVSVSEKETYIDSVISQQKDCNICSNLSNSIMCTASPMFETPEGAGIYCLEERGEKPRYMLHGISLNIRDFTTGMSFYTNVANFSKWLETH